MKQQRLVPSMTIFLTAVLVCFSQVVFGQRTRSSPKSKPRPVASPRPTPQKVASPEIKLDEEAKKEIDSWVNTHFQEWLGKRYFRVKTVVKQPQARDFEEEARRKAALETAERLGMHRYTPAIYTELENMSWRINKENIQMTPLDIKNNEVIDEWRGTVYIVSDKSTFSRTFRDCGWSKYREGFYDPSGNSLTSIRVYKRQGEWHFETGDKLYEAVHMREVIRILELPTLTNEESARQRANFIMTGRCQ